MASVYWLSVWIQFCGLRAIYEWSNKELAVNETAAIRKPRTVKSRIFPLFVVIWGTTMYSKHRQTQNYTWKFVSIFVFLSSRNSQMDSTLERTQIKDTMKTHLNEYQNNIRAIESCRFTRGIVLSNKIKSRQPIENPKETIKKNI